MKRRVPAADFPLRHALRFAGIGSPLASIAVLGGIALVTLRAPLRHDGLKERHFGAIQGAPKADLAEQDPLLLQQILRRNPAA